MAREYHKENCQSCIRKVRDLDSGVNKVRIIVAGQHAFKWSITLIKRGVCKQLVLPNRIKALEEFQRLLTQYRQVGDCSLAV